MMNPGDVIQEKSEITKLYMLEFMSDEIIMTIGSKFSYKGTPNYDSLTVTAILKQ